MFDVIFGRGKDRFVVKAGNYDIEVFTIYLKGYIRNFVSEEEYEKRL